MFVILLVQYKCSHFIIFISLHLPRYKIICLPHYKIIRVKYWSLYIWPYLAQIVEGYNGQHVTKTSGGTRHNLRTLKENKVRNTTINTTHNSSSNLNGQYCIIVHMQGYNLKWVYVNWDQLHQKYRNPWLLHEMCVYHVWRQV